MTTINEGGTGYSWADRQTGWDDPALGKHSGWRNPSWVDNDTVMISDPTHSLNYDVILDTLSDGDSGNLVHGWFSDTGRGQPAHERRRHLARPPKLAFATGENDSTLTVYGVPTFPTTFKDGDAPVSTRPQICYRYSGPAGGNYSHADVLARRRRARLGRGRRHQGRHRAELRRRLHDDGATPNAPLVIPGAKQPDWGPADVPAGRGAPAAASRSSPPTRSSPRRSARASPCACAFRAPAA